MAALRAFGAPLFDLTLDDLVDEQTVFQIGVAPVRIDLLCGIDGVDFETAWSRRLILTADGETFPVLSLADLAANKRAADRSKDLADLVWIEEQLKRR